MLLVRYLNWLIFWTMIPIGLSLSLSKTSMILWPPTPILQAHTHNPPKLKWSSSLLWLLNLFGCIYVLISLTRYTFLIYILSLLVPKLFSVINLTDLASGSKPRGWEPQVVTRQIWGVTRWLTKQRSRKVLLCWPKCHFFYTFRFRRNYWMKWKI